MPADWFGRRRRSLFNSSLTGISLYFFHPVRITCYLPWLGLFAELLLPTFCLCSLGAPFFERRQLTSPPDFSASYLSQSKHDKRLASARLLDELSYKQSVKQGGIAADIAACYNCNLLGNSLVVGRRTLDP